jgi:methionyl-tRNA formyltransferase
MEKKTKIIFFGSSDFGIPSLEALIKNKYKVVAVVTQPDREAGRGYEKQISPLKKLAIENKIQILQPEKIRDENFIDQLKELEPDLNIVCSYGKIIPEEIIKLPKFQTINIHPSDLPKYRGPSPIQTTVLNGDKETAITVMLMDKEMDHGDIIEKLKIRITNHNTITHAQLSKLLADKSSELLIKVLPELATKKIQPQKQDHDKATYTKIFTKEDGKIYWNKTSDEIDRQIRALNPWPGTFCFWHNHNKETTLRLKIIKAEIPYITSTADMEERRPEGMVFKTSSGLMGIKTTDDHLIIKEIQPEGKKVMTGKDFLNGYPAIIGNALT